MAYANDHERDTLRAAEVMMVLYPEMKFLIVGSVDPNTSFNWGLDDIQQRFGAQFRFKSDFISPGSELYNAIYRGSDLFGMPY